ncbi:MAG: hypothetical protein P4L72_11175 [Parvibaculum sp.]|jgi:hypothetical protein|uniref:hypothetical protein n=1 Tax=Parvibaculum sp. TaxID=2024848 RepID=UPI0028471383|nr:hypothetical protein [Parvibaculum sp.]MDR3499772.1 hypothetical protein [Parvibaculum sp.]
MILFRLIGLLLITVALMALGADAMRSLEAGHVQIRSLAEVWSVVNLSSYDSFTAWSSAHVPGTILPMVMGYPAWAVLGVIGIVVAGILRLARRS